MRIDLFRLLTAFIITALLIFGGIFTIRRALRIITNLNKEPFTIDVVCAQESNDASIIVTGRKNMIEGDYVIQFEIAGQDEVTICHQSGSQHRNWLIESFGQKSLRHTYTLTDCPEGHNLLRLSFHQDRHTLSYLIPFEVIKR